MAQSGVMNKSGVAFIVSNDYDCAPKFDILKGTHKDAERMAKVFTQLGYEVVARKNLKRNELISFISEAAALPYTPSHKRFHLFWAWNGW